jgi:hypothetical protein
MVLWETPPWSTTRQRLRRWGVPWPGKWRQRNGWRHQWQRTAKGAQQAFCGIIDDKSIGLRVIDLNNLQWRVAYQVSKWNPCFGFIGELHGNLFSMLLPSAGNGVAGWLRQSVFVANPSDFRSEVIDRMRKILLPDKPLGKRGPNDSVHIWV